jgi:hypothetical protein
MEESFSSTAPMLGQQLTTALTENKLPKPSKQGFTLCSSKAKIIEPSNHRSTELRLNVISPFPKSSRLSHAKL